MLHSREKLFVGYYSQVQRVVIMFGARERGRIVRHVCTRQIVAGKPR